MILEELKALHTQKIAEYRAIGLKPLGFHVWRNNLGRKINNEMIDDFEFEKTFKSLTTEKTEAIAKALKEARKKNEKNSEVNVKPDPENADNVEIYINKDCHWLVLSYFDSKARYFLKYGKNDFDETIANLIPANTDVQIKFKPSLEEIQG